MAVVIVTASIGSAPTREERRPVSPVARAYLAPREEGRVCRSGDFGNNGTFSDKVDDFQRLSQLIVERRVKSDVHHPIPGRLRMAEEKHSNVLRLLEGPLKAPAFG